MFRSLKIYSSARVSKQQSACAETFSLLLFYKNIVFFVGTSSWSFWDFERKSLVFDGKCLGSVLKNDFYLIRETFWLKCFEMIFEYKVCLLSLSERLFDTQQDFFVKVFKTAFCLSRRLIWKYFVKPWTQSFFWHRATIFSVFEWKFPALFSKLQLLCAEGQFGFFKINCDDFLDLERRDLGLWAKLLKKCSQKGILCMQNSIFGFCFPQWFLHLKQTFCQILMNVFR